MHTFSLALCLSGVVVVLMESSVVEGAVTVSVDGSSSTMLIIDVVSLLVVNIGLALSVLVTAGVANPGLLTVVVVVVVVIVTAVGWSSVVNALLVVISKVDDSMTFIIDVVSLLLVITRLEMSVLLTGCVINPGLLTDAVVRVCSVVKAVNLNALLVVICKVAVDVGSVHVIITVCVETVNSDDV